MKRMVMLLSDEPVNFKSLREDLEGAKFEVCLPKDLDDARAAVLSSHLVVILHVSHKTNSHGEICEKLTKEFPGLSTLHLSTDQNGNIYHRPKLGFTHIFSRLLGSRRVLIRNVKKLFYIQELELKNQQATKLLELIQKLDPLYSCYNLFELKHEIVKFIGNEFKAKGVYFLNNGSYGYYLQEMWKVTNVNQNRSPDEESKHKLVSFNPSSERELSDHLNKITRYAKDHLTFGWELRRDPFILNNIPGLQENYWIIPLPAVGGKKVLGHILVCDPAPRAINKQFLTLLAYVSRVLGRHLDQVSIYTEAKSLSYIDDLTELYNQRYLRLVLEKEISRASRGSGEFSVLFMDIDHFKKVNDSRGHLIGSKVLIELSKILQQNIRSVDYGFRYGGDEFMLILVGTGSEPAMLVAERIRQQVEESFFDVDDKKVQVTLSIGVATFPEHAKSKEEIIELADRAMYCGKKKSRNVVYIAS